MCCVFAVVTINLNVVVSADQVRTEQLSRVANYVSCLPLFAQNRCCAAVVVDVT